MKKYALLSLCGLVVHTACYSTSSHASQFILCDDNQSSPALQQTECITVKAPMQYQPTSSNQQIDLFVRRFPAKAERQGSIWLIAGGPGESGASFYSQIDTFHKAFPNFELLVPDHRGTGYSSSICPQESVDSLAGKQLVGEEWGACFSHMYSNMDYVQSFSITNAAHDLAGLIEQHSGSGKHYVYGVSYGTQLVLRLLQLPNVSIDGVLLDSLVPLQDDTKYDLTHRSTVVNDIGLQVLARKAPEMKAKLKTLIADKPLLSDYDDTLPKSKLSNTLGLMLDVPKLRKAIPSIIKDLDEGNIEVLQQAIADMESFYGSFNQNYKNFGSSIPLVQVISSSETNPRSDLTQEALGKEEADFLFTSPLPGLLRGNRMPTYEKDAYFAQLPKSLPPVTVLHGSLDPKTHFDGAKAHVKVLSKSGSVSLVEVIDAPHFIALNAPECFVNLASQIVKSGSVATQTCSDKNALFDNK